MIKLAVRYIRKQPRRAVLTVIGIIISTALICGTGIIIKSSAASMVEAEIESNGNYHFEFRNTEFQKASLIGKHMLVEKAGISRVSGFAVIEEIRQSEPGQTPKKRLLRLIQSDPETLEMLATEKRLIEGRMPEKPGEALAYRGKVPGSRMVISPGALINAELVERYDNETAEPVFSGVYKPGLDSGSETLKAKGTAEFTVTGILKEPVSGTWNYCSDVLILSDFGINTADCNVLVRLRNPDNPVKKAERIAGDTALSGIKIEYNNKLLSLLGEGTDLTLNESMDKFRFVISLIIMISTVIVIYNSFNIACSQRVAEYGVLRCTGATTGQVMRLVLSEGLFMGIAGIPLGIAAGFGAMKIVFMISSAVGGGFFSKFRLYYSWEIVGYSAAVAMITVVLSAVIPALKSSRIPPVTAASGGLVLKNTISEKNRKKGKAEGFSSGRKKCSPFVIIAARNIEKNKRAFIITVLSMTISTAMFIGFGGLLELTEKANLIDDPDMPEIFIESYDKCDTRLLEQLINDERVLYALEVKKEEISIGLPESVLSEYYKTNVEAFGGFSRINGRVIIPGCRLISYGDDFYRNNVEGGEGKLIIVREGSFITDNGVKLYAPAVKPDAAGLGIEILTGKNRLSEELRIGGVLERPLFDDYNESEGGIDIIVSPAMFQAAGFEVSPDVVALKMKDSSETAGFAKMLDSFIIRNPEYTYTDISEIAEAFTKNFSIISLFFYGFISMIALIGMINIMNTVNTNLMLRQREFGMLQAVGMTEKGLMRIMFIEVIIYAVISAVFGAVFGILLEMKLFSIVGNVRAAVYTPSWDRIAITCSGVVTATLAAAFRPMRKSAVKSITEKISAVE